METTDIKAYSKDLRLKVLDAVDREMPRKQVARIFGVSLPSIERWLKRRRESGDVEPSPALVLRPERVKARDRQWQQHYAGCVCSQSLSQLGCSRIWRYGLARLAFRLIYGYIPFVAAPIVLLFLPIAVEFGHVFGKVIGRSATLIGDRPIATILMNTAPGEALSPVSA